MKGAGKDICGYEGRGNGKLEETA